MYRPEIVIVGAIIFIALIIFSFYLWRKEKKGEKYVIEF